MFDGIHEIGNITCDLALQRMPPIMPNYVDVMPEYGHQWADRWMPMPNMPTVIVAMKRSFPSFFLPLGLFYRVKSY
jgi:hypothetical protein